MSAFERISALLVQHSDPRHFSSAQLNVRFRANLGSARTSLPRPLMTQSRHLRRVFETEDAFPIILHADDNPTVLLGLVVECLGEGADFGVWQSRSWAVSVFARRIIVEDDHFETRAATGCCVFEHLAVAGGVTERGVRALADHKVNSLGLAGVIVVEEKLRVFNEERLAVLFIPIGCAASSADHLLGRDAVGLLRIGADEVLPTSGNNIGLLAIVAKVLQHLLHRLVGELRVWPLPARILRSFDPLLRFGAELVHRHAGECGSNYLLKVPR